MKAGDHVRAGQALVQIDPDKQQATVVTAQAQRAEREADVAYAKQQLQERAGLELLFPDRTTFKEFAVRVGRSGREAIAAARARVCRCWCTRW